MWTLTVNTNGLSRIILYRAGIQTVTFPTSDTSNLTLTVGCGVAITLALVTPDRLRNLRFFLISQESDLDKLGRVSG